MKRNLNHRRRHYLRTLCQLHLLETRTVFSTSIITFLPIPDPNYYQNSNPGFRYFPISDNTATDDKNLAGDITIDATTSIPLLHLHITPHVSKFTYTPPAPNAQSTGTIASSISAAGSPVTSITYIANSLFTPQSPSWIPYRIITPDGTELAPFTTTTFPTLTGSVRIYREGVDVTNSPNYQTPDFVGSNTFLDAASSALFKWPSIPLTPSLPSAGLFSFSTGPVLQLVAPDTSLSNLLPQDSIYTILYSGDANYASAVFNLSPNSFALPSTKIQLDTPPRPMLHQTTTLTAHIGSSDGTIPNGGTAELWTTPALQSNTFPNATPGTIVISGSIHGGGIPNSPTPTYKSAFLQSAPIINGVATFDLYSASTTTSQFVVRVAPTNQYDGSRTPVLTLTPAPLPLTLTLSGPTGPVAPGDTVELTVTASTLPGESADGQAVTLYRVNGNQSMISTTFLSNAIAVASGAFSGGTFKYTFTAPPGDYQYMARSMATPTFGRALSGILQAHESSYSTLIGMVLPLVITSRIVDGTVHLDASLNELGFPITSPTGPVTFSLEDGTPLGSASFFQNVATIETHFTPGNYQVRATFPGDSLYAPENATLDLHLSAYPIQFTTFQLPPSTSLEYNDRLFLQMSGPGIGLPYVQLRDTNTYEIFPLEANGNDQFSALLPIGNHSLVVETLAHGLFSPSSDFHVFDVHVARGQAAFDLQFAGSTRTLTLTSMRGDIPPTGAVTLYDGAKKLETRKLKNGDTTWSTAKLAPGPHNFKVVYAGDSRYTRQTLAIAQAIPAPLKTKSALETVSSTRITGWAIAPSSLGTTLQVGITIDNTSETLIAADQPRDFLAATYHSPNHGFTYQLPPNLHPGKHTLTFYIIDPVTNRHIPFASRTITTITPLFDEAYYLANNPTAAAAVQSGKYKSAYDHFIRVGQFKNLNPSLYFDTAYYLAQNPSVLAALKRHKIKSAFDYFLNKGQQAGQSASAAFNQPFYLASLSPNIASELAAMGFASPLEHFLLEGRYAGLSLLPTQT